MKEAYEKQGIIIKDHSRCCFRHFDPEGFVNRDEFAVIPTRLLPISTSIIKLLETFAKYKPKQFEKFKDMRTVTNKHCKFITGWSKTTFNRFCFFITSIRDSERRNKEQLVALYRFWLRKGVGQKVLATMFDNKTQQKEISNFLAQIRSAIYNDFVPYFLGPSRGREYFLQHNNVTTKILHKMKDDELAVFPDGTYARCEKSLNNEFQYDCWSGQKSTNLTKPFLICFGDGYILDCYGPFKANNNDAKILDYILETDQELRAILQPKKTIFIMDRGKKIINLLNHLNKLY
jgi:hypothetical protein